MKRWLFLVLAAVASAALLTFVACTGGEERSPTVGEPTEGHAANALHIILDEWSITGEGGEPFHAVAAGEVVLEVHNEGIAPHELTVIRTDLTADALPVKGGRVDVAAAGESPGGVAEFPGGQIRVDAYELEPGRYVFICNIPGHYQQGMYAELTVE